MGSLPDVKEIRPGVFGLPAPMGELPLPASFYYAIESGDGRLHLVDSGLDSDENWNHLVASLRSIDRAITDIATVTITHLHVDHAGLASRIRAASGARIRMHVVDDRAALAETTFLPAASIAETLDRWGVPSDYWDQVSAAAIRRVAPGTPVQVDEKLEHDDRLDVGERVLRVMHVPGHTPGHIVLVLDADRLVFSGDHLLPTMFPGIGLGGRTPGDEPIGDYFRSLNLLSELDDYTALPGHGSPFSGIAERRATTLAHHRHRSEEIAELLNGGPSVWDIAAQVSWTGGWQNLGGTHLFSALSQTEMHMEYLRRGA